MIMHKFPAYSHVALSSCIFVCSLSINFYMIIFASSCSPKLAPKCTKYSLLSLIKYVKIVWSIVQDFLPFFTVSQSSNSIFDAYILKFFMQSFSYGSLFDFPVTPMIDLSKYERNFYIFSGVSRSGSTDTNTVFKFRYWYSGIFRIFWMARLSLSRELGQMSGQFVNPKYMR